MNEGMPQGVIGMEKEKVFHLQSCASEKCFIASQTQSSSS
jgi:flagellar assembly factor FliW